MQKIVTALYGVAGWMYGVYLTFAVVGPAMHRGVTMRIASHWPPLTEQEGYALGGVELLRHARSIRKDLRKDPEVTALDLELFGMAVMLGSKYLALSGASEERVKQQVALFALR